MLRAALAAFIGQFAVRTITPSCALAQKLRPGIILLRTLVPSRANHIGPHVAPKHAHLAATAICDAGLGSLIAPLVPRAAMHHVLETVPGTRPERVLEACQTWLRRAQPPLGAAFPVVAQALTLLVPSGVGALDHRDARKVVAQLDRMVREAGGGSYATALKVGGRAWSLSHSARAARLLARHGGRQDAAVREALTARHEAIRAAERERLTLSTELQQARRALDAQGGPLADRLARADKRVATLSSELEAARRSAQEADGRAQRDRRRAEHLEGERAHLASLVEQLRLELGRHAVAAAVAGQASGAGGSSAPVALSMAAADQSPALLAMSDTEVAATATPEAKAAKLPEVRVTVFTGNARRAAHEHMTRDFLALGAAQVDVIPVSGKLHGPQRYQSDGIVVCDLSFMGHATSEEIARRAKASGCWYYQGRHGPSSLAFAVAERYAAGGSPTRQAA